MKLKQILSTVLALSMTLGMLLPNLGVAESAPGIFYNDYESEAANREASRELYAIIASEGNVLLKNQNHALPLGESSLGISLFGLRSELTYFSGAGSAGGDNTDPTNVSLREALESEGYRVNPTLHTFIATESRKGTYISEGGGMFDGGSFTYKNAGEDNLALEIPVADYPENIAESYKNYSDVAILVFGRQGSEGADSYRGTQDTVDENGQVVEGKKHYLELTDDEEALVEYVKAQSFGKIIVLINTGVPMEMENLEKDEAIDAIVWIGMPGAVGLTGTAGILSGNVNPSGKTVDIWAADFKKDPTYVNFNDNEQTTGIYLYANTYAYGEFDETVDYKVGDIVGRTETTEDFRGVVVTTNYYEFTSDHPAGEWKKADVTRYTPVQVSSVEYEEGIYVGYRYYETRAAEYTANPDWYAENVVYPFGYGLSYTSFDWELVNTEATGTIEAGDQITLTVRVTNTGDTAGKDVIEVYAKAPYTAGGIEKAYVTLVDYVKTDLLASGESAEYTLSFDVKELASFDDRDANGNGFAGYEIEAGDYEILLQSDSHTVKENCVITRTVSDGICYDGTTDTLNFNGASRLNAEAIFSQDDKYNSAGNGLKTMSRADMSEEVIASFPTAPVVEDHAIEEGNFIYDTEKALAWEPAGTAKEEGEAWYSYYMDLYEANKDVWTQASAGTDEIAEIQFKDMFGVARDDEKWDAFLNQLTWEELKSVIWGQMYNSTIIERLGMPTIQAADGPGNVYNWHSLSRKGTYLPNASMVSSTWNDSLSYEYGIMIVNEAMWDDINQWYSPAVDMHRTPFSGRSFEYYSEESLLAGRIAGNIIKGTQEKGLICTLKHFGANEQEFNRSGLATFATEQTLREVYFKAYDVAIQIGNPYSLMTAMNRIGMIGCDNNFQLITTLLRGEWGFDGYTMSDMGSSSYGTSTSNTDMYPRAGLDNPLSMSIGIVAHGDWNEESKTVITNGEENIITWAAVRNSAKSQIYALTKSSLMDNFVDISDFAGTTVETAVGQTVNTSIAIPADVNTGAATLVYELVTGNLPEGVSLNPLTGALTGTPTAAGTYPVQIAAVADHYVRNTQVFVINVDNGILSIAGEGEDALRAAQGESYNGCVSVAGYTEIFSQMHRLTAGSLPEGLTLDPFTGVISGTPERAGVYTFTVITDLTAMARDGFVEAPLSFEYTGTYTITVE
ncbi:MAG: glycoside hydrolase family 3 C-terminal domain-containing protein [Clostridia bacterium]|nr:glycoside hydrolase family 3 C-terminal domain-containing protein [Clostridia bacterium]